MAGRPPKSHLQIVAEGKNHMTKAELELRKQGESASLSGDPITAWPEVADDPLAHAVFLRICGLLRKVSHDDALYEPVINRYCLLSAECKRFEVLTAQLVLDIDEVKAMRQRGEIDSEQYLTTKESLQARLLAVDKRLMDKRAMLFAIEKENIMTIMGALRAIPKKVEPAQQKSKMADFLERRQVT